MNCSRCGVAIKDEESVIFQGKTLCEDCYMYESNPPKACDPLAVASALSTRKSMGQKGAEGLSDRQKKLLELIEKSGRITKQELAAALNIKPEEVEAEFAVLRHCELVRAQKEGNRLYFTKW